MKYKKTTLPNGLRIITVPMKTPTVTVLVAVEAGAAYENKEENGISHFLEHMCFKGTSKRPTQLDITLELEGMGAENNAYTAHDFTGYHAKGNKRHLPKLMEIISDMYLNPIFPQDELEKERGVIVQEIARTEDSPTKKVYDVLLNLLYGDTPAGRTVLGSVKNIRNLSREDFIKYRDTHYISEKTIVVVAGDVEEREVVKLAKKHFQGIHNGKRTKKQKVEESQSAPALKIYKQKRDQANMVVAFRAFKAGDKRAAAVEMLSAVLGMGMSSRLFHRVRSEMSACYFIGAYNMEFADRGVLVIPTGIDPARIEEITRAILEECQKLTTELVGDAELNKAKEYYLGHLYMRHETSDSLADFYAEQELVNGHIKALDEVEKEIRAVTPEDIRKVARTIFKNERLNLAVVGDIASPLAVRRTLRF